MLLDNHIKNGPKLNTDLRVTLSLETTEYDFHGHQIRLALVKLLFTDMVFKIDQFQFSTNYFNSNIFNLRRAKHPSEWLCLFPTIPVIAQNTSWVWPADHYNKKRLQLNRHEFVNFKLLPISPKWVDFHLVCSKYSTHRCTNFWQFSSNLIL